MMRYLSKWSPGSELSYYIEYYRQLKGTGVYSKHRGKQLGILTQRRKSDLIYIFKRSHGLEGNKCTVRAKSGDNYKIQANDDVVRMKVRFSRLGN